MWRRCVECASRSYGGVAWSGAGRLRAGICAAQVAGSADRHAADDRRGKRSVPAFTARHPSSGMGGAVCIASIQHRTPMPSPGCGSMCLQALRRQAASSRCTFHSGRSMQRGSHSGEPSSACGERLCRTRRPTLPRRLRKPMRRAALMLQVRLAGKSAPRLAVSWLNSPSCHRLSSKAGMRRGRTAWPESSAAVRMLRNWGCRLE